MNSALFWLLQVITCSLPLAGAGLFGYILLVTSSDTPITEWSVSDAFASYPDYQQLLVVLIIAASLICATTALRNIQIRIWFRRRYGNYLACCCSKKRPQQTKNGQGCLAFTNDVASVVNIAAYISFLILAIIPIDSPTQQLRDIHNFATVSYFFLSIVYGSLQVLLTCKQGYPKFVPIVQLILVITSAGLSLIYIITFLATDSPLYLIEWLAVISNLVFIAFFAVLFHYDSAADELVEYLCPCCCNRQAQTSTNNNNNNNNKASHYRNMA